MPHLQQLHKNSYNGRFLGITHQQWNVRRIFRLWCGIKSKNEVHKLILQATPIIVFWKIWKSWAACKYGYNSKFNKFKMEVGLKCVKLWKSLNLLLNGGLYPGKMTPTGMININTDGSFNASNGKSGIGGVVRNEFGDLIMAFSIPSDCSSNNMAEANAAIYGSEWCIQHSINKFIMELDSLLVDNLINDKATDNLKLRDIISKITRVLKDKEEDIIHCFREANQVADYGEIGINKWK